MDTKNTSGSKQAKADTQQKNDDEGSSENKSGDVQKPTATDVEQTGDILKLNYLSIGELVSVSKTCKRMAEHCFQQNYSGYVYSYVTGFYHNSDRVDVNPIVLAFAPLIPRIEICNDGFPSFFNSRSKFQQLKHIDFGMLKIDCVNRLKEISLGNLEELRFNCCNIGNNFDEIIDQCVSLKCLEIAYCDIEFNWLNRQYPTLEYLKLFPKVPSVEGIASFLELNPNIRKFAVDSIVFWQHRDEIKASHIKLDNLALNMYVFESEGMQELCDFLNELHERGFYRKLELYFILSTGQEQIDQLTTLNGLVKLSCKDSLALSTLTKLEELFVNDSKLLLDLEMMAINLVNLERIGFWKARMDDILPFIKQSKKMQKIRVKDLQHGVHFNKDTKVIDLRALNREREQLPDAAKITLFVEEHIYLATKRALDETDFNLILLQRKESFEWDRDFDTDRPSQTIHM